MPRHKRYLGRRIQRLRQRQGLTQAALARRLEVSPSYLNQIEHDQRPLTLSMESRLAALFGDVSELFDRDDPAGLAGPLEEALRDLGAGELPREDLSALAGSHPQVAKALLDLYSRHTALRERAAALEMQVGDDSRAGPLVVPSGDRVRDFFNRSQNYIPELDELAERLVTELKLEPGHMAQPLRQLLRERCAVSVEVGGSLVDGEKRTFSAEARRLSLPEYMSPGQRAFQMAAQFVLLAYPQVIDAVIERTGFKDDELISQARVGLSNYFAGAMVMPYGEFLLSATQSQYDLQWLAQRFGVGLEAVCHRLSTLNRRTAPGLPLFFIRVDRAGNVSKRHSATEFHFSQVGGTCPLWIVYEAFNQPQRILTQIARMPDGRRYFWIACQVSSGPTGFGRQRRTFAVALGCDLRHAQRMVYSRGLDLNSSDNVTLIGPGCRVCERERCVQRAFPAVVGRGG